MFFVTFQSYLKSTETIKTLIKIEPKVGEHQFKILKGFQKQLYVRNTQSQLYLNAL